MIILYPEIFWDLIAITKVYSICLKNLVLETHLVAQALEVVTPYTLISQKKLVLPIFCRSVLSIQDAHQVLTAGRLWVCFYRPLLSKM